MEEAPGTCSPLLSPTRQASNTSLCPSWCTVSPPDSELELNEVASDPVQLEDDALRIDETLVRQTLEVDGAPRNITRRRSNKTLNTEKLGSYYLVYCVVCLLLTGVLLATSVWECFAPRRERHFWRRELRPWEEATEAFVGAALCTETFAVLIALGPKAILKDRWRLCDAAIAGLTLLCAAFFVLRRAVRRTEHIVEDVDVPMLALRFALQPFRMVSTAAMVVRAKRMKKKYKPPEEAEAIWDPRRFDGMPNNFHSILSPSVASQLRELLPGYLQYVEWNLAYSPQLHGTSLKTFYRRQAGANVLVIADAQGGIFGGYAAEAWQPRSGAYGNGESFVFLAASGSRHANGAADEDVEALTVASQDMRIEVHRATLQRGEPIQWSDGKMLGLGHAVVVQEDLLRGSSGKCEAFGCQSSLSSAGDDFVIRNFECWHVGKPLEPMPAD